MAGTDVNVKIGIDGEAEFKKQISECNNSIKTMGTEVARVTSAFIGNENSTKALKTANKALAAQFAELSNKADLQRNRLAELDKAGVDPTSAAYQKLVQDLNKTETEMNKTSAQIDQNNEKLKHHGKTAKEAHEKHAEAAKKAAAAVAKVTAAVAGMATALASSIVKSSVEAYAEYEQLAGGVETLFGKNAATIERYANEAFKTAGLSANEYMSTVTSFSASLLQSLGGDTLQASYYADQAIRDMSDNANKMGTSMESIQTAYQGFAKQNYTMLDNLKLGYGGTKEEMERLITDAEKMNKSFKATRDENGKLAMSFSDIVDAIHIVQDDMGITGTTAREAGETISGSLDALKSAWENLVTGFSNPDADLGALIGNVVESAETALSNLLPVVVQALGGLANAIAQVAPIIAEKLPGLFQQVLPPLLSAVSSLINGVLSALPSLLKVLGNSVPMIVTTITTGLLSALPDIVPAALDIVTTLAEAITSALPELIPVAVDAVLALVDTLTNPDSIGQLVDAAIAITLALANGLIQALPQLLAKAPEIIANLVTAIVENVPKLLTAAAEVITTLVSGIVENLDKIGEAAGQIIGTIVQGVVDLATDLWNTGKNIVDGIWQGISDAWQWFKEKVNGFFSGIVDGVKSALGIASPSKVFAGIGENMALGLGVGWDKTMDQVERDMMSSIPVPSVDATINGGAVVTGGLGSGVVEEITIPVMVGEVELARVLYRHIVGEGQRIGPAMVL